MFRLALLFVVLTACAEEAPLAGGTSCPCVDGFVCCPDGLCQAEGVVCGVPAEGNDLDPSICALDVRDGTSNLRWQTAFTPSTDGLVADTDTDGDGERDRSASYRFEGGRLTAIREDVDLDGQDDNETTWSFDELGRIAVHESRDT